MASRRLHRTFATVGTIAAHATSHDDDGTAAVSGSPAHNTGPSGGVPAGLPPGYPFRAEDEVAPRDAVKARAGGASFVDVRTKPEFDICRIEGSLFYPLQTLESRMDDLKAELEDDLDRPLVVLCHHGRRSLMATFMLRAAGFRNVRSLAGGIHLWATDIDPSMPRY